MGEGFLKFRWAPFLLAVITLVACHFWAAWLVDTGADYFVSQPNDVQGWQSKMFAQETPQHGSTAYFVGGSGMLWSLSSETELRAAGNAKVSLRNYAYPSQSIVESYAILKKLPLREGDVVFLHLSPARVNRALIERTNLLCRPYLYTMVPGDILEVYDELGYEAGVNPLCRVSFLARSELLRKVADRRWFGKPLVPFASHVPLYFEHDPARLEQKRREGVMEQRWSERRVFGERWLDMDGAQLARTRHALSSIRIYLDERHVRLILVDLPLNRRWYDEYLAWDEADERTYQEFGADLRGRGYEYHDWRWRPQFAYEDFYDHEHMVQSGRDKTFPLYELALQGRD